MVNVNSGRRRRGRLSSLHTVSGASSSRASASLPCLVFAADHGRPSSTQTQPERERWKNTGRSRRQRTESCSWARRTKAVAECSPERCWSMWRQCSRQWAASVLSSPNPSRLSTPSPARDVLSVYVSVYPRGVQPSRTDTARSSTCRTRRSSIWGTRGPYSTMPTDGRCTGQRCPLRCRCSSGSRREWISRQGRRRCWRCRVAPS
jgi:hypothetical protein